MGTAVGAWAASAALYYAVPQRRRSSSRGAWAGRMLGRALITLALVLYPTACASAVGLLVCETIPTNPTALAALDGGGAISSASPTVSVLSSNPFFVCWKGSHRAAGGVAAATLLVYVFVLPVLTLVWARHAARAEADRARARRARCLEVPEAGVDGGAKVVPPLESDAPKAPADDSGEAAPSSGNPGDGSGDVDKPAVAVHWLRRMWEDKDDSSALAPAPWRHTDPIAMPLVADFTVAAWCGRELRRALKRQAIMPRPRRLQVQQDHRPLPHTHPGHCQSSAPVTGNLHAYRGESRHFRIRSMCSWDTYSDRAAFSGD